MKHCITLQTETRVLPNEHQHSLLLKDANEQLLILFHRCHQMLNSMETSFAWFYCPKFSSRLNATQQPRFKLN